MDVTARRLHWTTADGPPEYVSGELVIEDPGEPAEYAVHVVGGYAVDPDSLVAQEPMDLEPGPMDLEFATPSRPPSSFPKPGPPSAAP